MLSDANGSLTTRIACPIRSFTWEPLIGAVYAADRLKSVRTVLETRQPLLYRLDSDDIEDDLKKMLAKNTRSVLVVPIRIAAENIGVMIFGEERHWNRSSFTNDKIQLAVAISKQVATGLSTWWCRERLTEARRDLKLSYDKIIKAERLATLGEVTRAVEHEINNPLSVIVNWSEIFRDDDSIDPEIRKKFQIIYDMSMRIMAVIRKLSAMKDTKAVEVIRGQKMTHID
jgi:C4-dicarboxylate-specific signal transduction histidine kinase